VSDLPGDKRQVSGNTMRGLLRYLDASMGADAVRHALRSSGMEGRIPTQRVSSEWFTAPDVVRLAEAATALCGDPGLGRRVGEEEVIGLCRLGLRDMVLALGEIPAAIEQVLNTGMRLSSGRTFKVVERSECRLVVESDTFERDGIHPFFCDYVAGVFASVIALFDVVPRVVEPVCQARGDDLCRFVLSWSQPAQANTTEPDRELSAKRFEERLASLESMHAIGSALLGSYDLDDVLDQICEQAGVAVSAHRFLLAVRVGEGNRLRVHHKGFQDQVARAYAERLMAGKRHLSGESALVADIAPHGRARGVLAAFSLPQVEYSSPERRTLEAYARHAASALDVMAALDDAQRDRDTARALLELASVLASVGTTEEIVDRLTEVTLKITRCASSQYWTWSPEDQALQSVAFADVEGRPMSGPERLDSDFPGVAALGHLAQPFLVRTADAPGPFRDVFKQFAVQVAAIVPVIAHGTFLGLLTAAFACEVPEDDLPQLMATLAGLADHGAVALENATLIEGMRHQSLHDPLTGLPNRTLVEQHADRCLAAARRSGAPTALLFLDLDGFKRINDTLGHSAGDDLIRSVGERLAATARAADVLARIGGDEFVVLMPETDQQAALGVAERMAATLRAPFIVRGAEVHVSASIGIAHAPRGADAYEALLGRADAAMYRSKAGGRGRIHHAEAGV